MRNLLDNRKLQKWCNSFDASSFVKAKGLNILVPPAEFNVVFLLTHIYRHFLFEGIGLRQVMDYYWTLTNSHLDGESIDRVKTVISDLGMNRFASALMWVMSEVFEMERRAMFWESNEKEGRFLLDEIMHMGNFGKMDKRYKGDKKMKRLARHWAHLLVHYPSEVIWSPIWIVYHWFWKRNKLRKIENR